MVIPKESRGSFFRLTVFSWLENPPGGSCINNKTSKYQTMTNILLMITGVFFVLFLNKGGLIQHASASPGSFDKIDSPHKTTRRNKCEAFEKDLRDKGRVNVRGSTLSSRSEKDVWKMTASTSLLVSLWSL